MKRFTLLCAVTLFLSVVENASGAADSVVVFNEIQYHPADEARDTEWIELHSLMGVDVDVSGWAVTGGVELTFPEGTVIAGHSYLVLAAEPGHVSLAGRNVFPEPFAGMLDNGGETLRLVNNNGRVMDRVVYEDGGEWPAGADGSGATLMKRRQNSADAGPGNWMASREIGGTPGGSNFPEKGEAPVSLELISPDSPWSYDDRDTTLPSDWTSADFNDGDWPTGEGWFFAGADTRSNIGEGLLGYWKLDETDGTTARNSVSGGGDGALVNGPAWMDDAIRGRVLSFDGVNDYVFSGATIPQMTLDRDFTWAFWARAANGPNNNVIIGNRYAPSGDEFTPREFIKFTTTQFEFHRNGSGENIDYSPIPPGVWVHHAVVKSGSTLTYYRDGTPVGERGITSGLDHPQPFYFGGDQGRENWAGQLDDVAIWEKTLSDSAIAGIATGSYSPDTAPTGGDDGIVNLRTEVTGGATTHYFRSVFSFSGSPGGTTLFLQAILDDGAAIYLNGIEVHRENLPDGPLFHATRAIVAIDAPQSGPPIAIPGDALVRGKNVIAVEVHQQEPENGDMVFGLTLTAIEASQPAAAPSQVVFNEIAAVSDADFRVELANTGNFEADLSGGRIATSSGELFVLPDGTRVPANGYLTLGASELGFTPKDDERLFLISSEGDELLDARKATNRLRGRSSVHEGRWLYPSSPTFGSVNAFAFNEDIVINEIMYSPRPMPPTPDTPATFRTSPLINWNSEWRFNDSGPNLGPDWAAFTHSVGSDWERGVGPIGSESAQLPEPLQTVLARPRDNEPYVITYYFETEFEMDSELLDGLTELQLVHMIDDGAVFYLNGQEILRYKMDDGPVAASTTANGGGEASVSASVSIAPDQLFAGENRLSVEVHQVSNGSSDIVFGLTLTAAEELTPFISGEPFREGEEQWVELFNKGGETVDVSGWRFDDGVAFDFPEGSTIDSGAFLLIAKSREVFATRYPTADLFGEWSGNLSRSGERLRLVDAAGNPVDELHYHDGGRWPSRADGGGSSIERRDTEADGTAAESWAPSHTEGPWRHYSYRGPATNGQGDPTLYNEFIFGLLDAGEFLIDDISVVENPDGTARQLIQNGDFDDGLAGWRMLGNHSHVEVVEDPDAPGENVLHVSARGATEHMSNHAETTLKDGNTFVTIDAGREYEISFRAKWLGGSNQLHTRLYFNRLPRITLLEAPANGGTPGAPNSAAHGNIGPTFHDLGHSPTVPDANEAVNVFVTAVDPDGVDGLTLLYSTDGGMFASAPMTHQGAGRWIGMIPGQPEGAKVRFYVEGTDALGERSHFPADGPDSRAMIPWQDGAANLVLGDHRPINLRIVMTDSDVELLHRPTNVMSNDRLGCTVVVNESEAYYNCGVRLKGSEHGRAKDVRAGFNIRFPSDNPFLGAHETIAIDRSGAGDQFSQKEILIKHAINHAGGVPGMFDDLIHVVAPRSQHTGSAMLLKSRFDREFLDNQFQNGGDGTLFEYELVYPLSGTTGGVEDLKLTQDGGVSGVGLRSLGGASKELYRWHWLIKNNRDADDYSKLIEVLTAMGLPGAAFRDETDRLLDVDQWLRSFAVQILFGVADNYASGSQHNAMLYTRPGDKKTLYFPWDMDFTFSRGATSDLTPNGDLDRLIAASPSNKRAYYGHLHDIIETTFNADYMSRWAQHYSEFLPDEDLSGFISYINTRRTTALNAIQSAVADVSFQISTPDGLSVNERFTQIQGEGWVDLGEIRVAGGEPLPVVWVDDHTWSVTVPVAPGPNPILIEAYDRQGRLIGSDTVTVVGENEIAPADASNLAIAEIMYHPGDPTSSELAAGFADADDFEFIELLNTSDTVTVDLTGVVFTDGITFALPSITLAPDERVVVAGVMAAYEHRYGIGTRAVGGYQSASGNKLANTGESLVLSDAAGRPITSVKWSDQAPWPTSADGDGYSLTRMLPGITDPTLPIHWRTSAETGGTPGTDDQISLTSWMTLNAISDLSDDRDLDGRTEFFEFATGGDPNDPHDAPAIGVSLEPDADNQILLILEFRHRLGADEISFISELSKDLAAWTDSASYVGRTNQGDGTSLVRFSSSLPASAASSQFIRLSLRRVFP